MLELCARQGIAILAYSRARQQHGRCATSSSCYELRLGGCSGFTLSRKLHGLQQHGDSINRAAVHQLRDPCDLPPYPRQGHYQAWTVLAGKGRDVCKCDPTLLDALHLGLIFISTRHACSRFE